MSEWIKMSDRKPDVGSTILIFDGLCVSIVAVKVNDFGEVWFDGSDFSIGYEDPSEVEDTVEYWMPLPEPPKGE